jgi:TolA-binding protein
MRRKWTILATVAACGLALPARGDTLWIASASGGNPLQYANAKVLSVADGKIVFSTGGRETTRELSQVARLQLDDEPALSTAEEALAQGKLDAAVENYRRVLDSTPKPWLKTYAATKLASVAPKANRFDAAAAAYVTLLLLDPQRAAALKPAMPDQKSNYLVTAINDVNTALAQTNLAPAQRQSLQGFLLELQRARGDEKAATETAQQLLQSAPTGAAAGAAGAAASSMAKLRLDAASAALQGRDYAKAIQEITAAKALLTTPREQADALYTLAEARAGLATQKNDAASWQDAALAYMRVVAHFKDSPFGAAYVPRSLFKTAQIEEQLNDVPAAKAIYQQLIEQYPNDQSAAGAKLALQRLGGGK